MSVSDQMAILENGEIRQIDQPHKLYDRPNSTYVASILGAPAMNFIAADDTSIVHEGARNIESAQLGIRPENLRVQRGDGGAKVISIEPMGATTILTLSTPTETLKAALRGSPKFMVGEPVKLSVDPVNIQYFDAKGHALAAM